MYMQRIEVEQRTRKAKPTSLKIAVGFTFLVLSAAIMTPWALLLLGWFGVAAVARATAGFGRLVRDTVHYAGECVVGR